MTLLGTLLKNRRGRDSHSAWNRPNLQGPELLVVTSEDFGEGEEIPLEHAGKRVGGNNLSPDLTWSPSPPETTELLLVVEDLDVPTSKPAVHCLALIDPSRLDSPTTYPQARWRRASPPPGYGSCDPPSVGATTAPNRSKAMDRTATRSKSSLSRAR